MHPGGEPVAENQAAPRHRLTLLSILVIPVWAFSDNPVYLGVGAFFMQFLV